MDDMYMVLLQMAGRAYARQQQKMWRLHGTATEDDLLASTNDVGDSLVRLVGVRVHNTGCSQVLHEDLLNVGSRLDGEVAPAQVRLQEHPGRVLPHPIGNVHLGKRCTPLAGAIVVGVVRNACLACGLDPNARHFVGALALRVLGVEAADLPGALAAMELGLLLAPAKELLGLLEVGQHLVVLPSIAAPGGPVVVVDCVAPDVEHPVDGRAAAQHLAARPIVDAVLRVGLRSGLELPVRVHALQARCGDGHVDVAVAGVVSSCLEQKNRHGGILREAAGDHSAGRACAHDDEVEVALVKAEGQPHGALKQLLPKEEECG
mmetsp:Transcript_16195/g.63148  ORF Transcript_16195/g.63148 Transcript_16195/m.63148 type:complete len:319 (+) Transcript_16195:898-1854(+)